MITKTVTLPEGVQPGQKVEVRSPDGRRTVDTVVPYGLKTGQTFLVKFPPSATTRSVTLDSVHYKEEKAKLGIELERSSSLVQRLDQLLTPVPEKLEKPILPSRAASPDTIVSVQSQPLQSQKLNKVDGAPIEPAVLPTVHKVEIEQRQDIEDKNDRPDRLSLVRSLEDFFTPRQDPPPKREDKPAVEVAQKQTLVEFAQKLVEVQVPPGLPAGATIFVEIPGENRTVSAQVPPGAKYFHVAYTPSPQVARSVIPTQAPSVVAARQPAGREKLLSVRVPPGTPAGTLLHVSVPNEPGRILAAQVPPGNVTKFHVSYVPRETVSQNRLGMLPTVNAYRQVRPDSPQQDMNTWMNSFFSSGSHERKDRDEPPESRDVGDSW